MSKLREIIRAERQRQHGPARGPRILMRIIWEPVLSPAGDRIVGKRQTGARAKILGDPQRRIWEQHDESLEAFEKRVEAEAGALHQTRSGTNRKGQKSQAPEHLSPAKPARARN